MATLAAEARNTLGVCNYCKTEVMKGKMTQHLKFCKERKKIDAERDADRTKQKTKLFTLLIEGTYRPQYWMQVELPASKPLEALDFFLRDIWVECCGHLSAFTINGTHYDSEPEDFYFGAGSITIVGATTGEDVEEEEEEEDVVDAESADEDDSEEIAEDDAEDLVEMIDVTAWLAPVISTLENEVSASLLNELNKVWEVDELVAFLKMKTKEKVDFRNFLMSTEGQAAYVKIMREQNFLKTMLEEVEDTSMGVRLGKVLSVGQKFSYEYDFGTTTDLSLKVVSEREGVVADKKDPIEIMTRNNPPAFTCVVCGKPATSIETNSNDTYCKKHARKFEDEGYVLPIVNSPRMGECGYTGKD